MFVVKKDAELGSWKLGIHELKRKGLPAYFVKKQTYIVFKICE